MLVDIPRGILGSVFVLDHQPFVALVAFLQLHQHKTAAQFFSVQVKLDLSFLELLQRVEITSRHVLDNKRSAVPHHHRPRAVISFRNFPLEIAVGERMIFRLHRETLVAVALRRPFRHCPRFQRPVNREPEVVMQTRSVMLLHHKCGAVLLVRTNLQLRQLRLRQPRHLRGPLRLAQSLRLTRRLRRPIKPPLLLIFFELCHEEGLCASR